MNLPSSQEQYKKFNDSDSANASVLEGEILKPSIDYCLYLIVHRDQPSKPLNENKEMKHLQKIFLKSIYDFNGGKLKYGVSYCFQCKYRWFYTENGQMIHY